MAASNSFQASSQTQPQDRWEPFGIYKLASELPADMLQKRIANLDHILGGLTNTINTIESKQKRLSSETPPCHSSLLACHTEV